MNGTVPVNVTNLGRKLLDGGMFFYVFLQLEKLLRRDSLCIAMIHVYMSYYGKKTEIYCRRNV